MVEPVSQMPGAWEVAMGEYSLFEESLFLAISFFGSHTDYFMAVVNPIFSKFSETLSIGVRVTSII